MHYSKLTPNIYSIIALSKIYLHLNGDQNAILNTVCGIRTAAVLNFNCSHCCVAVILVGALATAICDYREIKLRCKVFRLQARVMKGAREN